MNKHLSLLLAVALSVAPLKAAAQQFPTVPSGTVIGRTQAGTGPSQAIPFATLIATMLASSPTIPTINTSTILFTGSTSGTATLKAQAVAGTPIVQLPTASGILADGATAPLALASTGMLTCSTCAIGVTTRTAAAALDLSAYTYVRTSGYAAVADGGEALFKNVGSTPFKDSYITAGTISAGGSSYTNGTYYSVFFSGGTGVNFLANVVVSGNAVTSVTPLRAGGYGFTVGDVLTAVNSQLGGTGSGFTYTVSTVSTPKASFTDFAGTHWQYVPSTFILPRQFGAVFNYRYDTGDAGATDDTAALQAAYNFSGYVAPTSAAFVGNSFASTCVMMPAGSALISSTLTVPDSACVLGQGPVNTVLKISNSFPAASNVLNLGDPLGRIACFGTRIENFNIANDGTATANAGTYVIFTNCAQQLRSISNVTVYSGKRGCLKYDVGYGGAANFSSYDFFCTLFTGGGSDGILIASTVGTTLMHFTNTIIEAGGGGFTGNGFNLAGGQVTLDGYHSEGVTNPLNVNMTVSTASATLMHSSGGNGCNQFVTLQSTNTIGNFSLFDAVKNGCTNLVVDGQPAGSNRATDAKPSAGWVAFNP